MFRLYQSSALSVSGNDVYLSAFSATNDTAEADRLLPRARMASSFSDRSTAVGPLLTVFKPYPCRFISEALGTAMFLVYIYLFSYLVFGIFAQDVDVNSNERIDPVDLVVIACEDKVHSISKNSPVRNSGYGNQGTGIESVALYNVYNVIV